MALRRNDFPLDKRSVFDKTNHRLTITSLKGMVQWTLT